MVDPLYHVQHCTGSYNAVLRPQKSESEQEPLDRLLDHRQLAGAARALAAVLPAGALVCHMRLL